MKWITDNWSLLLILFIFAAYFILMCRKNIKEWLLYAVSIAEKELGSGTGKLKLRQVYESFIVAYPVISKIVPFEIFSGWVDEALIEMRKIIENNLDIKSYITEEFDK